MNPKGYALDPLDQIGHRLAGSVGEVTRVPGGDLTAPALERATERAHLGRADLVGEVLCERVDPLESERLILVTVELANGLIGLPGNSHVSVGVAGSQQSAHRLRTLLAEALFGHGRGVGPGRGGHSFARGAPRPRFGCAGDTRRRVRWPA